VSPVHAPTLEEARHWFAEELRAIAHLTDERVVSAFAAVPRERFVGPGPWRIFHLADRYWSTPDADPRHLYHNVLIALDEARGINIGEPMLWAYHLNRIGMKDGERVLQLGAGSGYYTAILAELVGPRGRVDAIEIEEPLAATARRNVELWPAARIRLGDASVPVEGEWDVIVAFAGATAPQAWWLDALADGGRLLLPMTAEGRRGGFMLRVDRHGDDLAARSVGWVGFYPFAGARTTAQEVALGQALNDPAGQQMMRRLRRDHHDADETCWLHGAGWCLSKRELR
jgi:protein-L-isoaspartate(D-aspartate) O-methyltransferase